MAEIGIFEEFKYVVACTKVELQSLLDVVTCLTRDVVAEA